MPLLRNFLTRFPSAKVSYCDIFAEIFEMVHDGLEKDGHFVVKASDSDVELASLPDGNGVVHESLSGRVNVLDHHLVQSVDQQVHANSALH